MLPPESSYFPNKRMGQHCLPAGVQTSSCWQPEGMLTWQVRLSHRIRTAKANQSQIMNNNWAAVTLRMSSSWLAVVTQLSSQQGLFPYNCITPCLTRSEVCLTLFSQLDPLPLPMPSCMEPLGKNNVFKSCCFGWKELMQTSPSSDHLFSQNT